MRFISTSILTSLSIFGAISTVQIVNSEHAMAQSLNRIYLASPLGFSESGRAFKDAMIKELGGLGYQIVDPFALTAADKIREIEQLKTLDEQRAAWRKLNRQIGRTNQRAIDSCDAVLAILDGQDVDSGTAAEIGYAFARQKPILGYRGDFRLSADNLGATVNLQVEYFIKASGGEVVTRTSAIPAALSHMLDRKR